jgi:hypothetical protein
MRGGTKPNSHLCAHFTQTDKAKIHSVLLFRQVTSEARAK